MFDSMYRVQNHNGIYMVIFLLIAGAFGWYAMTVFRPLTVEASCADIAQESSNILLSRQKLESYYSFDNEKARCIEEAKYPSKVTQK